MICTPVRPRNKGRIQTSGTKKIPCLAMARNVAGTVWPMVWSIMLLIVTQPMAQKVAPQSHGTDGDDLRVIPEQGNQLWGKGKAQGAHH